MVTLENIEQHIIPFDQFRYKWRFTEEKYNVLPAHHLEQIRPLDKSASKLLLDLTTRDGMFDGDRLSRSYFACVEWIQIPDYQVLDTEEIIKKWLYRTALPFSQEVFASWDNESAAITTWKMIVKYWSDFYYPGSDDLVIVDKCLDWAVVFYHYDQVEFGTNSKRTTQIYENELVGTGSL